MTKDLAPFFGHALLIEPDDIRHKDMAAMRAEIETAEVLGNTPDWEPAPAFYRELADKSFKAVERGELPQTALDGLYKAGYTKANELMTIGTAADGGNWAADSVAGAVVAARASGQRGGPAV